MCIKKEMVKGMVRLFLVLSILVIEVNPYFYNFITLKAFIQFKRAHSRTFGNFRILAISVFHFPPSNTSLKVS